MPESYQPGHRNSRYGQNTKISDSQAAWVSLEGGKFVVLVGEDIGHGPDVILHHPRPGKIMDVNIALSNMTEQELDALENLIQDAFAWARPVVRQRDKEAKDAWDNGDDSHARNYRPLPSVVYRKRPEREHGQSV